MSRSTAPYRVVIDDDHARYAKVFRACSPRHAMNLAERDIRRPDWQADWQPVTRTNAKQEGVS